MERLLYFLKWRNLNERADLLNLRKSKTWDSPSAETQERSQILCGRKKKTRVLVLVWGWFWVFFFLSIAQRQSAKPIKKMQTRELRRDIPSLVEEQSSLFAYKKYALRVNGTKKGWGKASLETPQEPGVFQRKLKKIPPKTRDSPPRKAAVSLKFIDWFKVFSKQSAFCIISCSLLPYLIH